MIVALEGEDFAAHYPHVQRFFASFYERARGALTPGSLEREIMAGERACYAQIGEEKVVACALATVSPTGSITLDFYSGDDGDNDPLEMIEMFEAWRAENDVPLTVVCRQGWVRRLKMKERGYRETHRVMELG